MEYVDGKAQEWPQSKCDLYRSNIYRAFKDSGYKNYTGSFIVMAKAGEVYHTNTDLKTDANGFTIGEQSRPRCIMCPEPSGFGMMQAV